MALKIDNRRYIGSKRRLIDQIYSIVQEHFPNKKIKITDLFAGTGLVAKYFFDLGHEVVVNDNLFSNYVAYKAWISSEKFSEVKIKNLLEGFNNIDKTKLKDNYFSKVYGEKYFSINDSKKIGFIRDEIESIKPDLTEREYFMLIASLMYSADKAANTVGHFEHYLSHKTIDKKLILEELDTDVKIFGGTSTIYNGDSNEIIKKIEYSDVVYLDPPYNARQYINFYHVLENLAVWNKPLEFEGKSMKFKRDHLKSEYSRKNATNFFKELIHGIKAELIIVSYNNTYNAKSSASNNKIDEKDLINILEKKGKLTVQEHNHPFFNSGTTNFTNHLEKIYICEVY